METTHAHISQLIERFMEGQSTLAEEQELAQYFATHEVSDEWKPLKDCHVLFAWTGLLFLDYSLREPDFPALRSVFSLGKAKRS